MSFANDGIWYTPVMTYQQKFDNAKTSSYSATSTTVAYQPSNEGNNAREIVGGTGTFYLRDLATNADGGRSGVFIYAIQEVNSNPEAGLPSGYANVAKVTDLQYDDHTIFMKTTVVDNDNGTLTATNEHGVTREYSATFENHYATDINVFKEWKNENGSTSPAIDNVAVVFKRALVSVADGKMTIPDDGTVQAQAAVASASVPEDADSASHAGWTFAGWTVNRNAFGDYVMAAHHKRSTTTYVDGQTGATWDSEPPASSHDGLRLVGWKSAVDSAGNTIYITQYEAVSSASSQLKAAGTLPTTTAAGTFTRGSTLPLVQTGDDTATLQALAVLLGAAGATFMAAFSYRKRERA